MIKKLFSFFAIAALSAVTFLACEPEQVDTTIPLQEITVSPATLALEVGQTGTLAVAYNPTDATVKPDIVWATSDPAVATVEDGTVTAVGEGTAEIIAKADKLTAKCVVTVTKPSTPGPGPGPEPQPEDKWDYTPGEAYAAATNLWKPVADAGAEKFFYYLSTGDQWNGTPTEAAEVPFITKKESTYKIHYDDATFGGIWHNQVFIFSDEDHLIALNPAKKYQLKVTMGATKASPAFLKLSTYKKAADFLETDTAEAKAKHEGITIWEKGQFTLSPDASTDVESDEFYGIDANGINLIMAFGENPDTVDIYVKDIILIETGDAPVTPDPEPVDTWDYTPGENYLAANNLWKPVFDANKEYVYGNITAWAATVADEAAGLTKKESTYKFHFNGATTGDWSNCNFIVPDADHKVALSAGKNYMIEYVLGATKDLPRAFIKINKDDPTKDSHEGAYIIDRVDPVTAGTPLAVSYEFNGADCDNISFTIDFGGNPEQVDIYIKDLTIYEVVPQTLKFELKSDEEANMTAAADAAGAAIWHIDADKGVDFDAVVKLNGVATTSGVTVEKYEAGGGHVAINYAALTDVKSTEVWTVDVTTTNEKVENKAIALRLVHGTYAYTSLEELNTDILAAGDSKTVLRILYLTEDAKLYVTKKDKVGDDDYIFAQSKHSSYTGGVLLYKTGSGLGECNTIYGTLVLATTVVKGAPVVTKYTYDQGAITTGYDANIWPCEEVTIETLKANYNKYINAKVKIMNSTITKGFKGSSSSGERSGELKDATGTIAIYTYLQDKLVGGEAGWNLNQLTCWPFLYNTNKQVLVWSDGGLDVKNATTTISVAESKTLSLTGDPVALVATSNSPKKGFVFSSSASNVVEVDPATGVLTPKAAGNATITVSLADTTVVTAKADMYKAGNDRSVKYLAATAECAVTVQADAIVVPDPVEFDVNATLFTVTGSGADETATYTSGDITITVVRGTGTAFRTSDSDHVRLYQNVTLTVSSAAHTIASIEFTCTSASYATALANSTFSKGAAAASSSKVTVSNVSNGSTSATMGAQSRINHIKIVYEQ